MNRSRKIYGLLGVLAAVCAVTYSVSRYEERKEQIKNSDEVVMELDSEDVTSLSWEYEDASLAFHRDESWLYDEDEAFPVNEEKINELLETFRSFGVSFVIEEVEDYGQYGLDDPVCTIKISTAEESYEILLGDYSAMDEERYVSTGDGNVYLVSDDPMETFQVQLNDMILNDEIPQFDKVKELQFAGSENYRAVYQEENSITYSADDVYFTESDGKTLPLDTENVDNYAQSVSELNLKDYVTYNVSEEELADYGLDDPELSVTMKYTIQDEDSEEEQEGTFVLDISRDPEEKKKSQDSEDAKDSHKTDSEEEEEVTAYARVGESQIIYQIAKEDYEALTAASCDKLRHQELIWADFSDIYQVDISLEEADYTLASKEEGKDTVWYYKDKEVKTEDFESALDSLTVYKFTDEEPDDKEEIRLTVYLDNENEPEVEIILYRYDGDNCLAVVDNEPAALIDRKHVVDLIEAVHGIVLD